jgi:hypothetical protein
VEAVLGCGMRIAGCGMERRELTLGHVGELVFAHGLEGRAFELALEFRGNAEEVDCEGKDADDAGEDGEEVGGGHGGWMCWFSEEGMCCAKGIGQSCARDCNEE